MSPLYLEQQTHSLIGAAMTVHRELGPGFLEAVYEAAMLEECRLLDIPLAQKVKMRIDYKGIPLSPAYIADLIAWDSIILELKATRALTDFDAAQLLNYLKCSGLRLGLLINFATPRLEWRRLIL